MIVQIYSLTDLDDVQLLIDLGVDHVGIAPAGQGLPSDVHEDLGRQIMSMLPDGMLGSALTIREEIPPIVEMAKAIRPNIVHITSLTDAVSVETQRQLRDALPSGTQIMKAIAVGGPETADEAIDAARRYAPVSDFILLDTASPDRDDIGAAGLTHDWRISARIVEDVGAMTTVILAGGLDPTNVAEAIRTVRPAGVDSFSRTNLPGSHRKDPKIVTDFVREARRAAEQLV